LARLLRRDQFDEAAVALDRWLGSRRLVAAVINPSEAELRALSNPSDRSLEVAMLAIRSAFRWTRLFAEGMASNGGGAIVLPMPQQRSGNAAGEVVAYGLLGLARSRTMSKVPRVRCNAVLRQTGDRRTFARLVLSLATPELGWLSGRLLGTCRGEVTLFGHDQPRSQIFDPPGQELRAGRAAVPLAAIVARDGLTPAPQHRRAFPRTPRRRGPTD
jgi:hypothetical protein